MKVLIAGGGTGGHVYPGIAVAEELARLRPEAQVVFVGGVRGLEAQAVPEAGFPIRYVMVRGFPRRQWWRWPGAVVLRSPRGRQTLRRFTIRRPPPSASQAQPWWRP